MEVLKHGNTYVEKECGVCRALIGYSYRDIENKVFTDVYNSEHHTTVSEFVYCPECGSRLVLNLKIDGKVREIQ